MSNPTRKVVYIAHGLPAFSPGGAELAAYHLARAMEAHGHYKPYLLARVAGKDGHLGHHGSPLLRWQQDSITHLLINSSSSYDYFYNTKIDADNQDSDVFGAIREFLLAVRPDIVHFQHYIHIGMDLLSYIKSLLPDVRIVLTLHEYTAICANQGLMLKTDARQLCYQASIMECCNCFPYRRPHDFFLRERLFKSNFRAVDRFIAPSNFLKERYVSWGIDPQKILVIDNGRPVWERQDHTRMTSGHAFSVAFFGQLAFHKGWEVFFKAAQEYMRIKAQSRSARVILPEIRFSLYGSRHSLPGGLIEQLERYLEATRSVVCDHGAYEMTHMPDLLSKVDCVVLPSIWWENSQLVIQEAFMAGVPVICSNIGGMAEKVTDRGNGLHFAVGDHFDLLDKIVELADSPELYHRLIRGIPKVLSDREMAEKIDLLYDELLSANEGVS